MMYLLWTPADALTREGALLFDIIMLLLIVGTALGTFKERLDESNKRVDSNKRLNCEHSVNNEE